jgi:hypothetical protein
MSSYLVRVKQQGIHVMVTIFAGPDSQHRACAGALHMRQGPEADRFIDHLAADKFAEIEDERQGVAEPIVGVTLAPCPDCELLVFITSNNVRLDAAKGSYDPVERPWHVMKVGAMMLAASGGMEHLADEPIFFPTHEHQAEEN